MDVLVLRLSLRILLPLIVRLSFSTPPPPSTPPLPNELYDAPKFRSFPSHRRLCSDWFYNKSNPGCASAGHSQSGKQRARIASKLIAGAPQRHLRRRCGWLHHLTVTRWSRLLPVVSGCLSRCSAWSGAPLGLLADTLPACGRFRFRRIHEAGWVHGDRSSLDSLFFDARLEDVSSHAIGPLAGSEGPRMKPSICPHCPSCFIPTVEVRAQLPRGSALRWSKSSVREATHLSGRKKAEKRLRTATPRRQSRDLEQNREGRERRRFTDLILNPANLIFRTCHAWVYVYIREDWLTG